MREISLINFKDNSFLIVEKKDGKVEVLGNIELYGKRVRTPDFSDENVVRVYI